MPVREDMRSSSVLARGTLAPAAIHYESGIGWPGPVADSAEPGTKRSGAESPEHSGGTAGDLVPGTASPVGVHDDRPAEAVSRETGVGAGAVPADVGLRVRPERSYPPARVPEDPTAGDSMRRGPAAWRGERSAPDLGLRAAGSGDGGQPVRSSTGWPGPEPGGGVGVGAGEPEVSESPEPWSAAGESGLGWFTAGQTSDQVAEGTGQAAIADAGAADPGGARPGGPVPGAATFGGSDRPDADQAAVGSDWRLPVAGTGEAGTGVAETAEAGTGEAEVGEADAGSTGGYLAGDWDADLPGGTGSPGATGGPGRHAAAERIGGGERIAPRHGRPLGWYAAESEGVWPDRGNQVDVPPGAGSDLPDNRVRAGEVRSWGTSQPPGGPMIADGISYGARSAPASESEDEVAIPAAPDASADTPIARAAQAAMKARAASRPWPKPRSCRIMTIANQKGGVGKTTTAVNMAASLAMHGARVLVVDLDPQGNASTALDVEHRAGTSSIYHVLVEGRPLQDVIQQVAGFPYLYCAPATIDLAGAEIELVPLVAREARLGRAIAEFDTAELDYVLIDCPPSLGLLTVNALVAAPEVLIPIQCEYYALEGLEQLLRTIELVKSHLNPGLSVSTILLTMFDSRTRLASQVAEEVRSHFGDLVLSSVIPRSVRVSEAPSYGQSVMTYDPGSNGAVAYLEAAREMAYRSDGAG